MLSTVLYIHGIFPVSLKSDVITPLLKKQT